MLGCGLDWVENTRKKVRARVMLGGFYGWGRMGNGCRLLAHTLHDFADACCLATI